MIPAKKQGHCFIIGVGPGDPELMTIKARRLLTRADVIIAPKGKAGGNSTALGVVRGQVNLENKEIIEIHFPMLKVRLSAEKDQQVTDTWQQAALHILAYLDQGLDVAFPTLGDPAFYSTGFYVQATLQAMRPELIVFIIPGISAMACCCATAGLPAGLGDDLVSVVPAAYADDRLRQILALTDSVILMKVHKAMDRLIRILEELDLIKQAVLIERCGLDGEKIYPDIRKVKNPHYFSTILVRKQSIIG